MSSPSVPTGATGKFDTGDYANVPAGLGIQAQPVDRMANLKRGMEWLQREMYGLQLYARAITGNDKFALHIGPISCTDGTDNMWLAPQEIAEGQEPGPLFMAHFYHEIGHGLNSLVFNPRNSKRVEDAIKVQGVKKYGVPADHVWGSLEDGRIEELLYKRMPGARKHIIKDVINVTPKIVEDIKMTGRKFELEHLMKTGDEEAAKALVDQNRQSMLDDPAVFARITGEIEAMLRKTGDEAEAKAIGQRAMNDMGLLMSLYFASAGYDEQASQFGDAVNDALDDPVIRELLSATHRLPQGKTDSTHPSVVLMDDIVPKVIERAKSLGFFLDFDSRAMNPYTQQPQVIDWNDLTKAEQDEMRRQAKEQLNKKRDPNAQEVQVINAPKDLFQQKDPSASPQQGEKSDGQPQDGAKSAPGEQSEGQDGKGQEGEGDEASNESADDSDGSGASGASGEPQPGAGSSAGDPGSGAAGMDPALGDAGGHESDADGDASTEASSGSGADPSNALGEDADDAGASGGDVEASPTLDDLEGDGHGQSAGGDEDEDWGDEEGESSGRHKGGNSDGGGDVGNESDDGGDQTPKENGLNRFDRTDDKPIEAEAAPGSESGETRSESEATSDAPTDEEVEQLARDMHDTSEERRVERLKAFKERYGAMDEARHPPAVQYASQDEVARLEANDPKAQGIKAAMNMEVGEISGAPESKFVFKQRKIEAASTTAVPTLDEYRDVIAGEVNRLMAIFKQNQKAGYTGEYEIGTHIKGQALTAFATGQTLRVFDKRTKPKKKSYAVTLLVDQSGSMANSKIATARIALCLQATLLDRLRIPFEILGFATVAGNKNSWGSADYSGTGVVGGHAIQHDVFKTFDEGWGTEQRAKVLGARTYGSNLDGMALSWAWNRLKKRREQVKILMTYSDGQPNPDTDQQIRIMKHVIRQMHLAGAIAIGVGLYSYAPKDLYPKFIYCDNIATLPRLVTKALEEELSRR